MDLTPDEIREDFLARTRQRHELEQHPPAMRDRCIPCLVDQAVHDLIGGLDSATNPESVGRSRESRRS